MDFYALLSTAFFHFLNYLKLFWPVWYFLLWNRRTDDGMAHKPKILYPYYKESSSKFFGQMQISRGFILSVQSQNSFNSFSILCSPAVLKEENRLCRRFSVFCFTNFHIVVSGSIDDRAQIKKKTGKNGNPYPSSLSWPFSELPDKNHVFSVFLKGAFYFSDISANMLWSIFTILF